MVQQRVPISDLGLQVGSPSTSQLENSNSFSPQTPSRVGSFGLSQLLLPGTSPARRAPCSNQFCRGNKSGTASAGAITGPNSCPVHKETVTPKRPTTAIGPFIIPANPESPSPSPYQKQYRRNVPETYQKQLQATNYFASPQRSTQNERAAYHKQVARTVTVHWFNEDDKPSQALQLSIDTILWPYFHPKDSNLMQQLFADGTPNPLKFYSFYSFDTGLWTITDGPQTLKGYENEAVYLRNSKVTSSPVPQSPTPRSSPSKRPRSPSVEVVEKDGDPKKTRTTSETSETTTIGSDIERLQSAPGVQNKLFPYKYACDMDTACRLFQQKMHSEPAARAVHYPLFFNGKYTSSTFGDHYTAWTKAQLAPGGVHGNALTLAVEQGRSDKGLWAVIATEYSNRR
ncbi:hypothetical protein C8J56DRAFT_1060153 [Mycena floridula]|nr:hypothetical protein C8J56DRAFT_1060153 [Mycena floridula]